MTLAPNSEFAPIIIFYAAGDEPPFATISFARFATHALGSLPIDLEFFRQDHAIVAFGGRAADVAIDHVVAHAFRIARKRVAVSTAAVGKIRK